MSDTIFYSLKINSNKSTKKVFERIQKKVKPKGATAKWIIQTKGQSLIIDFGDGASETFCLHFVKKQAEGFCKVAFPMDGKLFENEKKSEWKTLILILHSLKTICSEINIDDDYSIAGEYFNSLDYKFDIRELQPDEIARLDQLFKQGYTNYEAFLLKIFSEDTQRKYPRYWEEAINPGVKLRGTFPEISTVWETYIFETSTLNKQCLREIYKDDVRPDCIIGDAPAEIYTFGLEVGKLFSCYNFIDNKWGRGANVTKYHNDKFLPVFENADDYGKCKLAYQFMKSVYEYCKFTFVGKDVINEMIDVYEKEHPPIQ
ncbi:MAG: hypothetical protein Q4F95_14845 [Oscillospiraceae bacterium]|nr:hypothetical protein [Oscillospiraceae bacterium]